MESKRMKMEEKADRISGLPDSIIQYILSLLPSTKEAIRTGILSKRWENQWTQVPVLILDSAGMSFEKFLNFIDNTLILHDCSKINKFHLIYRYPSRNDPQFSSKIRFATRKDVDELYLGSSEQQYKLPNFLFNNASLVNLVTGNCIFMPNGKISWECLTKLVMTSCRFAEQAMELILSGTPLLKILNISYCFGFNKLVIASNSLENLGLKELRSLFDIEISCPKLERLMLSCYLNVKTAKLLNLPSSLSATVDFKHYEDQCNEIHLSLIKDILQQLQHVKELRIGSWLMEYMSSIQMGDQFSPVLILNIKCLAMISHNMSGIESLLRNSPQLEKLEINVATYDQDYCDFGENYWSDATVFNCLNARVLEKMIIQLKDDGTDFPLKVSQELLNLPRCSQCAVIELRCTK
ncbi:F-box/LRR-repeat protein 25-like isoform X2 [Euphorbia lathyris]|uniref:F-box/LRR-repeat protein 25-like isoform X2 n=1 Tax=Euphorbia lathyris TaxID=212925 RepID=UPI0033135FAD